MKFFYVVNAMFNIRVNSCNCALGQMNDMAYAGRPLGRILLYLNDIPAHSLFPFN